MVGFVRYTTFIHQNTQNITLNNYVNHSLALRSIKKFILKETNFHDIDYLNYLKTDRLVSNSNRLNSSKIKYNSGRRIADCLNKSLNIIKIKLILKIPLFGLFQITITSGLINILTVERTDN